MSIYGNWRTSFSIISAETHTLSSFCIRFQISADLKHQKVHRTLYFHLYFSFQFSFENPVSLKFYLKLYSEIFSHEFITKSNRFLFLTKSLAETLFYLYNRLKFYRLFNATKLITPWSQGWTIVWYLNAKKTFLFNSD